MGPFRRSAVDGESRLVRRYLMLVDVAIAAVEFASGLANRFGKSNMEFIGFVMCCVFVAPVCKVIFICRTHSQGPNNRVSLVPSALCTSWKKFLTFPLFCSAGNNSEYVMQGHGWRKWARFMVTDLGLRRHRTCSGGIRRHLLALGIPPRCREPIAIGSHLRATWFFSQPQR